MADLLLAARNLVRNRRRALTALLTVVAGVVAMMLADGFIQWIFWAMREGTIQGQLGHIQVVRPGYRSAGAADPFQYLLPETSAERAAIESTAGVKLATPRLTVNGLISHGETTVSFVADGIDPATEAELSQAFRIVAGADLPDAEAREVILGRGLAANLAVEPGDTVVLLATTASGGINAVEATVAGLFITASKAYDDTALRLPIGLAQTLLRVEGAHMWLLLLEHTERTDYFLDRFRGQAPAAANLEFVPWYVRADFYNKTVTLFSRQMQVLQLIIAIIIVLSISNMLIMNVLERTGEVGTLMAVGLRRRKILKLFLSEGFLLGIIGGTSGAAAGYGLAELISTIGIPMPPPPGMEEGYTGEIRLTWDIVINAFAMAVITTALAAVYPAWKASRLQIVDALRHNV